MPEDDPFDGMASRIVVSRTVFEQLYDPVIEPKIPETKQFRTLSMLRDRRAATPGRKRKGPRRFCGSAEASAQRQFDF